MPTNFPPPPGFISVDSLRLATLADVHRIAGPSAGGSAGGGSGATTFDDLTDVNLTGQADGDFLSRVSGAWVPVDPPSALTSSSIVINVLRAMTGPGGSGATVTVNATPVTATNLYTMTNGATGTGDYVNIGSGTVTMLIDLGAQVELTAVRILGYPDGRTYNSVKLEVSPDNSNWTTIRAAAAASYANAASFLTVTASGIYRYVRYSATGAPAGSNNNEISEFEVYGKAVVGVTAASGPSQFTQPLVQLMTFLHKPLSTVGAWTRGSSSTSWAYILSSGAQNDEIVFWVPVGPGTYDMTFNYQTSVQTAIATIDLDDGTGSYTNLATVDTYLGSTTDKQTQSTALVITGAATRRRLRVKAATKNASSSNYFLSLHGFVFERTA